MSTEDRDLFVIRNQDDTITICFTARGHALPTPDDPTLTINQHELIRLANSLDGWRAQIKKSLGLEKGKEEEG